MSMETEVAAKKPKNNKTKARTSMWLSRDLLKTADGHARQKGISRTMLIEQILRERLGLGVGVETDVEPSVFG